MGEVSIAVGAIRLAVDEVIPESPGGMVVFTQAGGGSRRSSPHRYVARVLQEAGFATVLMDLLTVEEERVDAYTGHLRFDIDRLADRLVGATDWIAEQAETRELPIGYFGAGTGAAAALVAAVRRPDVVKAVVSRGGRPDLAGCSLRAAPAATLLIVGGMDRAVIPANQEAFDQLGVKEKRLETVAGATHLFEEPGAVERVAGLACDWFSRYLAAGGAGAVDANFPADNWCGRK